MTPQEAIEIITNAIQTENMTAEQDKALAIVQKATDKLIPKKVKSEESTIDGFIDYICPICQGYLIDKTSNCSYCGQALDWGG